MSNGGMPYEVQSVNQYGFTVRTLHAWRSTAEFEERLRKEQGHTNVCVVDERAMIKA